jgi:hypothetical protein
MALGLFDMSGLNCSPDHAAAALERKPNMTDDRSGQDLDMTIEAAAARLDISVRFLQGLVDAGKIKVAGGDRTINESAIREFEVRRSDRRAAAAEAIDALDALLDVTDGTTGFLPEKETRRER